MKKRFEMIPYTASLLLLFFQLFQCDGLKTQQAKTLNIKIDRYLLNAEIAATPQMREKGLMCRTRLRDDEAMLFVFPYPRRLAFWMKNTLIPLDIGYFSPEGFLLEYMSMQPDDGTKTYPSSDLALYAVETNVDWFKKRQIRKGAKLHLPRKISAR